MRMHTSVKHLAAMTGLLAFLVVMCGAGGGCCAPADQPKDAEKATAAAPTDTAKAAVPAEQPKAAANIKTELPSTTIPASFGFNIHITGPDKDWDEIKSVGGKYVRWDFSWDNIEKTKGVYNLAGHDKMLDALDARGIRVVAVLAYRNPLYKDPETTDEGREAYSKFAAECVKHFKGRGFMWEIWNEPNVGFWHGTGGKMNSPEYAQDYVALVKKALPAMRAADPDCYILGGSVSCLWKNSFQWVDAVFKEGLLQTGINALSVHPYGYPRPELCMEGGKPGEEGYDLLREKMAKANAPKDFPVLDTEVGYSLKKGNPEQQGMLGVRTYLVDQMCNIRMTIWYNWDENDAKEMRVRTIGSEQPLPIYNAFKNMTAELTGFHYVERLPGESKLDYIPSFVNEAGDRKVVAWTTPQGRDEKVDQAKAHDVSIPTGGASSVVVHDLLGKVVEAKVADGKVTVNLTGSPVYVLLKK